MYDPGYYTAYQLSSPPRIAGRQGCDTRFERAVLKLVQRLLVRARDEGLLASRDDPEALAELIGSNICGAVHRVMLKRLPQEEPGPGDLLGACENPRLLLRRLIGTAVSAS